VAYWLKDRGFEAYAVTGGLAALQGLPRATEPVPRGLATGGAIRSALSALRQRRVRL
jgi:hypothetical protein